MTDPMAQSTPKTIQILGLQIPFLTKRTTASWRYKGFCVWAEHAQGKPGHLITLESSQEANKHYEVWKDSEAN